MATMAEAVHAALVGPERKKLRIYNHEFNVKPAQPEKKNNRLIVNGQISHHLSRRPDDQVYYIITIEDAAIKEVQRRINRGGLAGLVGPVVSVVGAYFGVAIPPDKVESISRQLGRVVDGSWEMVSEIIIANIAMAFQQKEFESKPSMQPGEVLNPDQSITSANGRYRFIYQGDGNLVLYDAGTPLWASGTDGRPVGVCIMQDDGNLVIYARDGQPIWSSDTWQHPGSRLLVQDDGNVVIYHPDGTAVWATNTWQ